MTSSWYFRTPSSPIFCSFHFVRTLFNQALFHDALKKNIPLYLTSTNSFLSPKRHPRFQPLRIKLWSGKKPNTRGEWSFRETAWHPYLFRSQSNTAPWLTLQFCQLLTYPTPSADKSSVCQFVSVFWKQWFPTYLGNLYFPAPFLWTGLIN